MARPNQRYLRRSIQLLIGLFVIGFSIALLVRGVLGASPWDVLTQGISLHVPLTFGTVTVLVGVVVMLTWIPLRQKPGPGTFVNLLMIGPSADVAFLIIPESDTLWVRVMYMLGGIIIAGIATGIYLGARLGPGPRDGLMTGLHRLTGRPIWLVRTSIEVVVVVIGFLLGGVVGVGTVAFAVLIGPLVQYFMKVFYVVLPSDTETV